jgi:hypothetical protein
MLHRCRLHEATCLANGVVALAAGDVQLVYLPFHVGIFKPCFSDEAKAQGEVATMALATQRAQLQDLCMHICPLAIYGPQSRMQNLQ